MIATDTQTATLRELTEIADSGTWGDEGRPGDGSPVLRSSDIADNTLTFHDAAWRTIPENDRERRKLATGDIIITKSSGSPEHIGKCAIFTQPDDGRDYYFSNFMLRIRAKRGRADHRWLFYWLSSERGRDVLTAMNSTTSGLRNLSVPRYLEQEVPIPFPDDPRRSLAEQKRIAAILDKADAIRRRRQEAARLADTLMMSGFHHIVGPLAQGYRSWKRGTIESLASPEPGSMRTGPFGSDLRHSEFVSEGVAVLGIDNAVQNRFAWDERRFITHEKYEYLQRYTVRPNDVIVTIMGTTGRSAVVPDDIPLAITTKHLATITVNRKVAEPEFVSHSIYRHPEVLTQIANSHRGAIMPGLNLGLIRRLEIPVPPLPVQQEFTRFVKSVRELESLHRTKQLSCDDLFNALVQRAFRGEL